MGSSPDYGSFVEKALAAGSGGRTVLMGEPDYLSLRSEIAKFAAPAESPSFEKLEALALSVAGLSADLLVYSNLCHATLVNRGYGAFKEAVLAWADLVEKGWEFCTPRKQQSEVFRTWSRRVAAFLSSDPPKSHQLEAARAARTAVQRLSDVANGALQSLDLIPEVLAAFAALEPKAAPVTVQEVPKETSSSPSAVVPETQPEPASTPEPPPAPAQKEPAPPPREAAPQREAAPLPRPSQEGGTEADIQNRANLERDAHQALTRLVAFLREEDIKNPWPYRMLRVVVWATANPPAGDKSQKTRLPAPAPYVIKRVTGAVPEGAAQESIKTDEELFRTHPLWIDLQHHVYRCLEALNATEAQAIVGRLTAELVGRFPELVELKFGNGTPFASEEAVAWLKGLPAASSAGAAAPVRAAPMPAPVKIMTIAPVQVTPPPAAMQSAHVGDPLPEGLEAGLTELNARGRTAVSGRERFEQKLLMAELCLTYQRADLAGPLAEQLVEEVDRYRLEVWEPDLATRVIRISLLAGPFGEVESAEQWRRTTWSRLCRLNPAAAAALSG